MIYLKVNITFRIAFLLQMIHFFGVPLFRIFQVCQRFS